MKIENLTLTFENCDYVVIDGKYIGDFLVDDIHTSFNRIACNAINKIDYAETVAIEIHKDANKNRFQFAQINNPEFEQKTFDRITKYDDITSIEFDLVDDCDIESAKPISKHYQYYVDWVGENEYENEAQNSYISLCGNLYLVIAKNKNIEDFFYIESINDAEQMDFKFDMYDVGDK